MVQAVAAGQIVPKWKPDWFTDEEVEDELTSETWFMPAHEGALLTLLPADLLESQRVMRSALRRQHA